MRPREKTGGATWTSEKFKNVQRLIERSRQLSGGCAFRECERMSDGECNKDTIWALFCYGQIWLARVRNEVS